MFACRILISVALVLSFILGARCLEMIPQMIKLTYANDKYLQDVHVNVRRYSRSGTYYVNAWGTTKHTWGNNVSFHAVVTEFLHNEYRRSFIEFHYKFCDLIKNEPMLGHMLAQKGIVCPMPKGEFRVMNMTVLSQNFPNRWPFEKGGAEVTIAMTSTKEIIATGYVHLLFKQDEKKT